MDGYAQQLTIHAMQRIVERHGPSATLQARLSSRPPACITLAAQQLVGGSQLRMHV